MFRNEDENVKIINGDQVTTLRESIPTDMPNIPLAQMPFTVLVPLLSFFCRHVSHQLF